jgi:hypothetical protein
MRHDVGMEAVRHTITLEIELDVDAPAGVAWSQELKDDVEGWVDAVLRAHADGRDITARDGASLRVDGHSVVVIPGAWPYR